MSWTVLVVDDEYLTRDLLRMMLERSGYTVCEAEDGLDALQAVETNRPDIVLMDAMMPRMDGFTAIRALRDNEQTASLPIIMLSVRAHRAAVEEGLAAGADRYLTKPISRKDLVRNIEEILAGG